MKRKKSEVKKRAPGTSNPHRYACPIMSFRRLPEDKLHCIVGVLGTAICISEEGYFLTASHVLEFPDTTLAGKAIHTPYPETDPALSIMIVNGTMTANHWLQVLWLRRHESSDIAVVRTHRPEDRFWRPYALPLSELALAEGEDVVSFGYSKTEQQSIPDPERDDAPKLVVDFRPAFYAGKVIEAHASGRPLAPFPCYEVTNETLGGISGGPLMRPNNKEVLGVCSRGASLSEGETWGLFSDIRAILDWKPEPGGLTVRQINRAGRPMKS